MAGDPKVYPDFFSNELTARLNELAVNSPVRKQIFWLPESSVPTEVKEAAGIVQNNLKLVLNQAILKCYRLTDKGHSQAYLLHQDPPNLGTSQLILCSLSGLADLTVILKSGQPHIIRCHPNTVVVMDPATLHCVTPPLNPDGVRSFLFFGYDTFPPA